MRWAKLNDGCWGHSGVKAKTEWVRKKFGWEIVIRPYSSSKYSKQDQHIVKPINWDPSISPTISKEDSSSVPAS